MFFWQVDAQLQVVRKLEEKERLLQGTINTAERELALRTQALDMNKRKVARCRHFEISARHSKQEFISPSFCTMSHSLNREPIYTPIWMILKSWVRVLALHYTLSLVGPKKLELWETWNCT